MRFTLKEQRVLVRSWSKRYQKGSKKEKTAILDAFVEATGYSRNHASLLLRCQGKRLYWRHRVLQADVGASGQKRGRKIRYGPRVLRELTRIWQMLDYLCGKRLAAILPEVIVQLEQFGELNLSPQTRRLLSHISPATIDRLLREERQKFQLKGRGQTKPGSLRKQQVPLKRFSEWRDDKPGYVEIDLVGHEGGVSRGDFAQTLDVTDICSGWTDLQAVKNKAQVWVFEALQAIIDRLPFTVLGVASDNGSEFINDYLIDYCSQKQITFCRSRPTHKNDNCHVEQKNYSVVRRAVGYQRYDTAEQLELLNELYRLWRLQVNFFQPHMKLQSKFREASRIRRCYDRPQTPYQRLLQSEHLSAQRKQKLRQQYRVLNPAELYRQIRSLRHALLYGWSLQQVRQKKSKMFRPRTGVGGC